MKRMFTDEEIRAIAEAVAPELPEELTNLVDVADLDVSENAITLFNNKVYIGLDEDNNGKISLWNTDYEDYADIKTWYDEDDDTVYIQADSINTQQIRVSGFSFIKNNNGESLKDAFTEINPTDYNEYINTFALSPTGYQLPNDVQSSLTTEQENKFKRNMLYWIKKGFICVDDDTIIKISGYRVREFFICIYASFLQYDNGQLDECTTYCVTLDLSAHAYFYSVYTM